MQFTALTALAILAPVLALPSGEVPEVRALVPDMTPRAAFNQAEVFAFAIPAGCSILSCINVIGEAVCIADAIEEEDWKNIFKCAKKKEICGCAGCFSALGGFLEKYGLC
ncbi:hypothetical protein C8A05DRAFT_47457 [Staphylotrichum tortipilum]|uniref:Fungal calcium binding protein domain-containing protein n=1 Tax=Staphylotrichum tortipilum TaxID=2831512 RepID=A0AAN6MC32_9PEZI|nr:hypothetical protein C8A05DRAFT_47457 [Staphylotrichum longicolle]